MSSVNRLQPVNLVLSVASVTASGANKTVAVASGLITVHDGIIKSQAAIAAATHTTDAVTDKDFVKLEQDEMSAFIAQINYAGTVKVTQGNVVEVNDFEIPYYGAILDGYVPFWVRLAHLDSSVASAANDWTFGGDNWNTTGMKYADRTISCLPGRRPDWTTATPS